MRMPLAGRVAVTVGLGILFASATGRTAVRQPGATVVPIELCRDFAVVVRGAIGALGDLRFLVDTGTARTVLTMRLADRLGLAGPDTSIFGFRGRMAARQIVLPAIRLGDARKESLEALAADLPAASGACEHDVIAGADLLRGTRFTIDYAARRLVFGGARRWRMRAAFDPRSPYLVAEVVIDGVRLRLLMDTGSELLAVYEGAAPADWHRRVDAEVAADNVTGGLTLRRLFARSVEIGGARWRDVQVFLVPGGGPDSRYDGVVGPRALGLAAIEFDLVGMTFSFDAGRPNAGSTGLSRDQDDPLRMPLRPMAGVHLLECLARRSKTLQCR
jgi:predicted aspartyl protease